MSEPIHASDCAIYNGPAYEPGPCDCNAGEVPADQLSAAAQEWRSAIRFARGALSLIDRKAICSLIAQINGERVVLYDRLSTAHAQITAIHDALNREAVARLIDPEAFDGRGANPALDVEEAYAKADQIIAAFREAGR